MTRTHDIAIVGAGIAGASLAFRLKDKARVILLEREDQPGYHATGRSTYTFVESYGSALIRRLTSSSRAFYETPPPGFSDNALFSPRGNLKLARDGHVGQLDALYRDARTHLDNLHCLSPPEAADLCPALRADLFASALYEPGAQDMDVHAIHQGFLRGQEILTRFEVTETVRDGEVWDIRSTDGRKVTARVLVNAAGAWASSLGSFAGASAPPLQPRRRSVFTFDSGAWNNLSDWPLVRDWPETFYFKPAGGGILATPANQTPAPASDVQPEDIDIAIGIDRLEQNTRLEPARLTARWAGLRTFSADEQPVVGFDPTAQGFFWLAGQGGYGIQTAPALSDLAASLLLGEETDVPPEWLSALDPARFS